ncbi:hypothetical protein KGM_206515 [Danaus plexippus plexippus]|uniref:Ribosomal protein S6 kinase delta-1 n=1 Tax=Danaus plexippus plexippus TaxID=278856 RepID=A0A212FLB6_DANPL|nr:hypothetical protein KGM_206515 [Danaus plexippus plexippus]
MSVRDKWVRRFSVDETAKHNNGFTIYKITSVLFPIDSPEAVTVISVWKRYSDVQQLHKSMKSLHAGLHLRGVFPNLARNSFFKRFSPEVIEERAKTIKVLLEFVAEHRLLFTSTDFVNFLQTGYPEPKPLGVIDTIRSSLHLPIEETPPLEYQSDNERVQSVNSPVNQSDIQDVSQIPIYEAADVEIRDSPKSLSNSFESLTSLESFDSDIYDDISKVSIDSRAQVKKVLPDLINFDEPSCSKFEDYHTMTRHDAVSMTSGSDSSRTLSRSNTEYKTRTDDSYIFEAGYMLNLAARCEDMNDYQRAFECYKSGIEKMLIGVQYCWDCINICLSLSISPFRALPQSPRPAPPPSPSVRRPPSALSSYRVLAALGPRVLLVLDDHDRTCYAMKVIQKIPNNLTEFDDYFQRGDETRQIILPTAVPCVMQLHSYIETGDMIFLILAYTPGVKLFDYIRNHARSTSKTPNREVNLENVFTEPLNKNTRSHLPVNEINRFNEVGDVTVNDINENRDYDISVKELVVNSQKLLLNVDKALTDGAAGRARAEEVSGEHTEQRTADGDTHYKPPLPPGAVRRWCAGVLVALHGLHAQGVVCRDLCPSNVLLSQGGRVSLTYFPGYDSATFQSKLHSVPRNLSLYLAPELTSRIPCDDSHLCDYWSLGAIMYYLICGFPLSSHHSTFTSHTILYLPEELSVEEESILTQVYESSVYDYVFVVGGIQLEVSLEFRDATFRFNIK